MESRAALRAVVTEAEAVGVWQVFPISVFEREQPGRTWEAAFVSEKTRRFWDERTAFLREEFKQEGSFGAGYGLALRLLEEGNIEEAEAICRELPPVMGQYKQILETRIRLRRQRDEFDLESLPATFDLKVPDNALEVARVLYSEGRDREARKAMGAIDFTLATSVSVLLGLSELSWAVRAQDVCHRALLSAKAVAGGHPRVFNLEGCFAVVNEDFDLASKKFWRAVEVDPLCRPAILNTLFLSSEYLGTSSSYRQGMLYMENFPSDLPFRYQVASHAQITGNADVVRRCVQGLPPDAAQAEWGLRIRALNIGNIKEYARAKAVGELTQYVTPSMKMGLIELLLVCVTHGIMCSELVTLARSASRLKDGWSDLSISGFCDVVCGDRQRGYEELEAAWKLRGCPVAVGRYILGEELQVESRRALALRTAETIVRRDGRWLIDWNDRVYAHLMAGDVRGAGRLESRVMERKAWGQSRNFCVLATRGLLLLRQGDVFEGVRLYKEAEKEAPGEWKEVVRQKLCLEVGRIATERGKVRGGRGLLQRACKGPDRAIAGEARELVGRLDE